MASPIFLVLLCFILCFSSSSQTILLPLTHSISKTQFNSTHHLLKSTSTRSKARFHHQHHKHQTQVSLPLAPGSDYTLSFNLGSNPPQLITLYMDTGSDLVWFPCSPFECILCEGKPQTTKPANITKQTHSVSCQSPACSAAHASMSSSNLCAISRCPLDFIETSDCSSFSCPPFYYAYGDGSFVANLYQQTLSISTLHLQNFTFGCAHTALAEPTGVAGFGRGILSLPAQLSTLSPHLGNRFSYCLVSHSFDGDRLRRPSPLILGRHNDTITGAGDGESVEFVYTSMLSNPKHPYYYCVGLAGISVGKRTVPAPEILKRVDEKGNGGMVVDSGTTFTMLPESFYNAVVNEFDKRVNRFHKRASEIETKTGLGPCYYLNGLSQIPVLKLHFVGNNSDVVLPRKNYFYEFMDGGDGIRRKGKVGCVMLMNGGEETELDGGPGATLGNYQQQGFEVVYDLEKERVGFAKKECALLWDSLNSEKN